ncbi:MAG: hypothetical protein WCL11_20295 [Verrucomicrobiota bacterium]|nr:hypothetical protein [Verrucomicrobiota bacterium]
MIRSPVLERTVTASGKAASGLADLVRDSVSVQSSNKDPRERRVRGAGLKRLAAAG